MVVVMVGVMLLGSGGSAEQGIPDVSTEAALEGGTPKEAGE